MSTISFTECTVTDFHDGEHKDLRDIDGIRKWFTASLTGMGNLLDLITESPALTGTTE